MKHRAKMDWWIGASVAFAVVAPWLTAFRSSSPWRYVPGILVFILVFGFCVPQWYETTETALIIRAGITRRSIPHSNILSVRHSTDSRGSLAMSLDCILIEHVSGDMLIAPKDQEAFFAEIARHAPQLARRGQDLALTFD
jgi:hypothetical protein